MNRKRPELLLPAGSLELLKIAVLYGADAVYLGGEAFSLRAKAKNFSEEEMSEGIAFAHAHGVKVYVTANILAHNRDLEGARRYFAFLREMCPDGILIADPGMFMLAKEICPGIPIHISTQANNVNYETFLFWHRLGAVRIVCGRELTLEEIRQIREHIPDELEIEAFIHGAMCISYSGRCLLSNYLTGCDANQGMCTHPCRWKYALMEETRPGEYMPVFENERGTFIFNSKDLCMVEHIPDLVCSGLDSLKIEGRMKTALYTASMARTYRKALDDFMSDEGLYRKNLPWYMQQISACTYREYTTGFYYGKPGANAQIYDESTYHTGYVYLGHMTDLLEKRLSVLPDGLSGLSGHLVCIEQKNKFSAGEEIEIMRKDGEDVRTRVLGIYDENGNAMPSAPHPKQVLYVQLEHPCEMWDILRRKV